MHAHHVLEVVVEGHVPVPVEISVSLVIHVGGPVAPVLDGPGDRLERGLVVVGAVVFGVSHLVLSVPP